MANSWKASATSVRPLFRPVKRGRARGSRKKLTINGARPDNPLRDRWKASDRIKRERRLADGPACTECLATGPGQGSHPRRAITGLALLVALSGQSVGAAGFYLNQVGTPGSLGTAGVANTTNDFGPDAAWANPAGLTGISEQRVMTAGLQALIPTAKFDAKIAEAHGGDGGDAGEAAWIPSFFYARPLDRRWSFGFGISALQGGGADYGERFAGRYGAIDVSLTGIGVTSSLAYRVSGRLSIGVGASLIQNEFRQTIAVNQAPAPDARVNFRDLDDHGVQGILGVQYRLSDNLMFGATYRSEVDAELTGNAEFRNFIAPLPPAARLKLDWTNPQWLEAGLRLKALGGYVFASLNWQDWSKFSDNRLAIETSPAGTVTQTLKRNWNDTWSAGLAYGSSIDQLEGWSFGVAYESSPVDDADRTIDFPVDENWQFSGSYSRMRSDRSMGLSLGATLQLFGKAPIDQTSQNVRFAGDFSSYYVAFVGAALRF